VDKRWCREGGVQQEIGEEIAIKKKKMKIIAGIPAYNRQYSVCGVIHAAECYVDEVIVVDDGEHGQHLEISETCRRSRAKARNK